MFKMLLVQPSDARYVLDSGASKHLQDPEVLPSEIACKEFDIAQIDVHTAAGELSINKAIDIDIPCIGEAEAILLPGTPSAISMGKLVVYGRV